MKKRICALALAALLLTGCGKTSAKPIEPVQSTADYSGVRMLQASDENGLYLFDRNDVPGWRHLCYIDYATQQAVPLCAQPNCTHDNENCLACLPVGPASDQNWIDNSRVWILDENTILVQYGRESIVDGEETDEMWLDLADRNGANRRTLLYQTGNEQTHPFYFSGFADEEALYGVMGEDGLYRLPLSGGTPELWIPEFSELDTILGMLDHKLIVQKGEELYRPGSEEDPCVKYPITDDMTIEEVDEVMAKRDQMYQEIIAAQPTLTTLYTVDVNSRKCEELCTWDAAIEPRYNLFTGKSRVWWLKKDYQVGWVDMNGKTGAVNVQWPEELKEAYANNLPEEKVIAAPEWETCGKLIISMQQPVTEDPVNGRGSYGQDRYAIDLESGAVTALPQHYIEGLTYDSPVNLWAETGDGFLVKYAVEYGKVPDSYMGYEAGCPRLGLISYEDFFAGKNTWQDVQIECNLDDFLWK